jgi:asparagine synthase (glutamine-hydrolysing)
MCGIAGKVGSAPVSETEVVRMCDAIRHRGPDDWGYFIEEGVGLGMRRLSIIDLAGGHQPMFNEDGSVVLVFNGEIYNFAELRNGLLARGHVLRTRSDTEVLVHLYEEEGEGFLSRLRGMFAFALWDRRRRRLLLARDHFGQKPLFYTESGGRLAFASEIKALLTDDPSLRTLNPYALDQYLALRFVSAPDTLFARIKKLPPAHYLVWEDGRATVARYWDLNYESKWSYSESDTLDRVEELLAEAVRLHLVSDVPVGAFLSGGLDSTLIAAFAAQTLGGELRTFSMGIPHGTLNELPAAAAVAARYGTQHHAEEIRPSVIRDLPRLVSALDEPADPLSICLLHLSRMTARHVKVVLGGDGGDELFGGYDRYAANRWLDRYAQVPEAVRGLVARWVLGNLPDRFTFKSVTHKLRWGDLMASKVGAERYSESLQYFWFNGSQRDRLYTSRFRSEVAQRPADASIVAQYEAPNATDPIDKMMYVDAFTRMPEQSLMILDRTTMAYSLESRSPFLDPRLAEFMARVPVSLKINGRKLRYLERRLAEKYLPPELLRRPKQGFASPLMYVMDAELRQLGASMLRESTLVRDGYLRAERVQGLLDEHLGRKLDHGNRLWLLLSAETWYQQLINGSSGEQSVTREAELATASAGTSLRVRPDGRPAV